jgi:curved DNA-binding protein CbpA
MDPYKVLGVDRSASNEEVKKKYRELVKRYHPDQHRDNPLGELADEKLKEINEAYDIINKERAGGGGYGGSSYSGGGSSYGGSDEFMRVRSLIQAGNITQAESMLDNMSIHNAEWHYLKGIVLMRKGWYDGAKQHFQSAYNMEPNNPEYANAFNQLNNQSGGYQNFYGNRTGGTDSCCNTCCCALGLDSCCECFGGDCIPGC